MLKNGTKASQGILLITDNPELQKDIRKSLEKAARPYDLLAVPTVEESLAIFSEARFEIALLDYSVGSSAALEVICSASACAVVLLIANGSHPKHLPSGVQDCLSFEALDAAEMDRRITYAIDRAAWFKRERHALVGSSPVDSIFIKQVFDASTQPMLVLKNSQEIVLLNAAASRLLENEPNSLVGEISPFNARAKESRFIEIPDKEGIVRQMELQSSDFSHEGELYILVILQEITGCMDSSELTDREKRNLGRPEEELAVSKEEPTQGESLFNESLLSMGHLAGGIAHDFNNILTAVLGNLSIVRMALGANHAEAEKLLSAEKAVVQAKSLTQQLLAFSKGGAPEIEPIRLDVLVRDCADFVLRGSNVRYEISVEPDLWVTDADQGQISQVIHNLLINADQAMLSGGVLSIRLENREIEDGEIPELLSGSYLCLEVCDSGDGISPENLKRIFEPYFTTKKSGNGLGLASCLSILKRHSGLLTVDSKLGSGSTFRVFLPKSDNSVENRWANDVSLDEDELPPEGTGRILIMDDMESMKEVAGEILKLLGYDICLTADGAEAIQAYCQAMDEGEPFRAVVFDLTVPGGMGGEEACRRLRAYDPKLLAVASSGYSTSNVMTDWKAHGFDAVVAKPYRIKDMGWVLHHLFQQHSLVSPSN
ncbi:MAG: ATP-binding protein [Coraliomargaritaceae bacterium]